MKKSTATRPAGYVSILIVERLHSAPNHLALMTATLIANLHE